MLPRDAQLRQGLSPNYGLGPVKAARSTDRFPLSPARLGTEELPSGGGSDDQRWNDLEQHRKTSERSEG
jgi:hypothetical protein